MKKLSLLLVMVMTVLIANAQPKASANAKSSTTPVKITDLPKAITDNIAKDYVGFTIKDANLVEREGVSHYHINIMKGASAETLVFDKDGKFLKKSEANSGMSEKKPLAKPATSAATKPVAKTPPKK